MDPKHLGSSLDEFLAEEGILEQASARSQKRALVWQIEEAMREAGITKAEMARRMNTSRSHLDRLLDPDNDKIQLDTLNRAAVAIGRNIKLALV